MVAFVRVLPSLVQMTDVAGEPVDEQLSSRDEELAESMILKDVTVGAPAYMN